MVELPYRFFEPEKPEPPKKVSLILYHGWGSSIDNLAFLAQLFAKWGYPVFTPEINWHDSRNRLMDPFKKENQERYFWETILESAQEAVQFSEEIKTLEPFTSNRIVLIGSSMGGFIATRAFVSGKHIDGLVNVNGSGSWMQCEQFFQKAGFRPSGWIEEIERQDPIKHLGKLKERPVLLLHGENDQSIPVQPQVNFYEKARTYYQVPNRITLERFPNVNHTTTLAMVECIIDWLETTFKPGLSKEY